MTPADLIADLDAALLDAGERITVRRYTGTGEERAATDIEDVPASVRAIKPGQLVGNVDQTGSRVVISPTFVGALLPLRKGDKLVIQGRERNIEFPRAFLVRNTLVRLELTVMG